MTERERLLELLEDEKGFSRWLTDDERRENLVDHLLEHGVIVPPVKVGDTVYHAFPKRGVVPKTVKRILYGGYSSKGTCETVIYDDSYYYTTDYIGRDVFLTKEEAEAALKEREQK